MMGPRRRRGIGSWPRPEQRRGGQQAAWCGVRGPLARTRGGGVVLGSVRCRQGMADMWAGTRKRGKSLGRNINRRKAECAAINKGELESFDEGNLLKGGKES